MTTNVRTQFKVQNDQVYSHGVAIQQVAANRLRGAGYTHLAQVACVFREGVLILRGRVPSFYLKQLAQSLVQPLDGVEQVDNRIEVALSYSR